MHVEGCGYEWTDSANNSNQNIYLKLMYYWKLIETSGTNAHDSINSNDGTLYEGEGISEFGVGTDGVIYGWLAYQKGLYFDGIDDCVKLPSMTIGGAMSIAMWVGYISWKVYSRVFALGNIDGDTDGISIGNHGTLVGQGSYEVYKTNDGAFHARSNFYPADYKISGTLTHIVWTISSNDKWSFYKAGELFGTFNNGHKPNIVVRSSNYLERRAKHPGREYFNGVLKDAQIYNYDISATEIKKLSTNGNLMSPIITPTNNNLNDCATKCDLINDCVGFSYVPTSSTSDACEYVTQIYSNDMLNIRIIEKGYASKILYNSRCNTIFNQYNNNLDMAKYTKRHP